MEIAIIGGSGLYDLIKGGKRRIKTEFGEVELTFGDVSGRKVIFLQRHGRGHNIPPHLINHKANILALRSVGVDRIIGISACGAISKYRPGDIVLVDDFIGFHLGPITYFGEEFNAMDHHKDFTQPYDQKLKDAIIRASERTKVKVRKGGVLIGTFGPRLETKAEIKAFNMMGANLVGMTSVYETILCRELDIGYCCLAVTTNYAAGVKRSRPNFQEVVETMSRKMGELRRLLQETIRIL